MVSHEDFMKSQMQRKNLRDALQHILLEVSRETPSGDAARRLERIGDMATKVLRETEEPGEQV